MIGELLMVIGALFLYIALSVLIDDHRGITGYLYALAGVLFLIAGVNIMWGIL